MNKKIIYKNNLINNLNYIKTKHSNIMAMVKANAYGHGLKQVVNILKNDVNFWGVANSTEAIELKHLINDKNIILVVGKTNCYNNLIKNNIHITVDCLSDLYKLINICKKINKECFIHIAVNSGMNRIGVKTIKEFKLMLKLIKDNPLIILSGVFTHLFDADYKNNNCKNQLSKFEKFIKHIKNKNILIHIGGSFALNNKLPSFINMVRCGLFLYGYGDMNLKKVMEIKSNIIKITDCKKKEFVGYGKTKLTKNKTIGLIPIGYADGICRNLSGKYSVTINNKQCKIIGKICMDMLMVDVTNKNVKINDEVLVFYNANIISKALKISPYEVLTNFNKCRAKTIIN